MNVTWRKSEQKKRTQSALATINLFNYILEKGQKLINLLQSAEQ